MDNEAKNDLINKRLTVENNMSALNETHVNDPDNKITILKDDPNINMKFIKDLIEEKGSIETYYWLKHRRDGYCITCDDMYDYGSVVDFLKEQGLTIPPSSKILRALEIGGNDCAGERIFQVLLYISKSCQVIGENTFNNGYRCWDPYPVQKCTVLCENRATMNSFIETIHFSVRFMVLKSG